MRSILEAIYFIIQLIPLALLIVGILAVLSSFYYLIKFFIDSGNRKTRLKEFVTCVFIAGVCFCGMKIIAGFLNGMFN